MMKPFANIATFALHPVALSIPAVYLLVYNSTKNVEVSVYWTFISMLFSGIIGVFVLFGVKKGFFNNLDVSNRRQRVILYPFVIAVVLFYALLVFSQKGPLLLVYGSLLFITALLILDIVNLRIKASIHVAVVSAVVTGIIYQYGSITYLLTLLIPLVAWARIVERRHTLKEAIVGGTLGIILSLMAIFIVQLLS